MMNSINTRVMPESYHKTTTTATTTRNPIKSLVLSSKDERAATGRKGNEIEVPKRSMSMPARMTQQDKWRPSVIALVVTSSSKDGSFVDAAIHSKDNNDKLNSKNNSNNNTTTKTTKIGRASCRER